MTFLILYYFRDLANLFNINTMKVLLDIDDDKAIHLLEVLKGLNYVRTEPLSEEKASLISELKAAVSALKDIRAWKKSANVAQSSINELR